MKKELTLTRECDQIFAVKGNWAFWSGDKPKIDERMAFDAKGNLSSPRAQAIDASNGNRYILIAPLTIGSPNVSAAAAALAVGETVTVTV